MALDLNTCAACGMQTPVERNVILQDGQLTTLDTYTYVCAHCGHVHIGLPQALQKSAFPDVSAAVTCLCCDADMGDAVQCPQCLTPRSWMQAACPFCAHEQKVFAPHMHSMCNMFQLHCVSCDKTYNSLCIC